MREYSGWQYLLIDVANNAPLGLEKARFEDRITWAEENLDGLENEVLLSKEWKEKPMYIKAVMAVKKALAGEPTGHLVGFDAVCSGMQIMSAMVGCVAGANATGLVDPDRRADAYTDCTTLMVDELGRHVPDERDRVKNAVMTSLYGSTKEPQKEFGKDSPELAGFYRAMYKLCPGACDLLADLLASWQSYALYHEWILPDGYLSRVKVMQVVEDRIQVDELDGASFTYQYSVNAGEKSGVKNVANVVHSLDAYVLRCLVRRCNYDRPQVEAANKLVTAELLDRAVRPIAPATGPWAERFEDAQYYKEQYDRSGLADAVIIPYLNKNTVQILSSLHLMQLNAMMGQMLQHQPFEVVTVHDDFKCHPNNMNHLRYHYKEILAELAESEVITDILNQIHGVNHGQYQKLTPDLADKIRNSSYALC